MKQLPTGGILGKVQRLYRFVHDLHIPLHAANASYFIMLAAFPLLVLRLSMEKDARLECLARYDDEEVWHSLCMIFGTDLRSFRLPLRPRRCDHMRRRCRGTGPVKIYSVAQVYEKGSDCS